MSPSSPRALMPEPPADCGLCPRLVAFRETHAQAQPSWFNGAVPSFGDASTARLLIVGLAPGLQGANKTGRPFTGDYAGDLLYATLLEFGFARGSYGGHAGDGLGLVDTVITNAVRCVPPANKPTSGEIKTCRSFLDHRMQAMPKLKVVIALGRIAHETILTVRALRKSTHSFVHGASHPLGDGVTMIDSYHCSRYNTNTRRLTTEMFHDVFRAAELTLSET